MPPRVTARQTHPAVTAAHEIRFTMRKAPRSPTSSARRTPTLDTAGNLRGLFAARSLLISAISADESMEGTPPMIELTRLNGSPLAVNCDLIKYAESAPDTVLTLITGEKLVVLEPCSEVSQAHAGLPRRRSATGMARSRSLHSAPNPHTTPTSSPRTRSATPPANNPLHSGRGHPWISPASVESHSPSSAFSPA